MVRKYIKKLLTGICTCMCRRQCGQFGVGLKVNFPCRFTKKTFIGNYCNFNGITVEGEGTLKVGDYFHSGKDIRVILSNHNYDGGGAFLMTRQLS